MTNRAAKLLRAILPEPKTLLDALAPEGWTRSPLHRVFHPTPEQRAEEARRFREVIENPQAGAIHEGTVSDARAPRDTAPDPEREVVELLGMALWDVFSNGNSVVDAEGRAHDLGSFRSAAGLIAQVFEERYPAFGPRDYLDFYMGTTLISHRADLRPLYRWIFDCLRQAGRDWRFVFPRIHAIRLPEAEEEDFEAYDPSRAVQAELERGRREEEFRALKEKLDRMHEQAVARARHLPPPSTVAAYRDVYGVLPEGWPLGP